MGIESQQTAMSEGRGLLTESEREAIAGERSDSYRYKTRSYFQNRVEEVGKDVEVLGEHAPDLLEKLQEQVCDVKNKNAESKREEPHLRNHDTYEEDHWKVLDVEGVDDLFSTHTADQEVRVDFDGFAAQSVMRDLANEGDNVNVSAWFSIEDAEQLVDQLEGAIAEAKGRDDE